VRILIDTREQAPFTFERFHAHTERLTLPTGDYSLPGFTDRIEIERKELNDLIACLMNDNRERFERELARAQHYELFCVVGSTWKRFDFVSEGSYTTV
jgi:ERCC4-type nuclease